MDVKTLVDAVVLGLVEGLTEFIPVSSTGHLLLVGHFLGFKSTGRAFEVLIQLGAILALLVVYFGRLRSVALALPVSRRARRFTLGVFVAFLPAAIIGVLAHDFIKRVLFESPGLICTTLLLGGIVLLVIDRLPLRPRYGSAYDYPLWLALVIGCFQVLALVPGMSRSGSTIVGALLFKADKRSAAEFSFFLAMPTMAGAFAYDLYKNRDALSWNDALIVAIGFVAAFLAALVVVRRLLDFVSRHGFAPFAYWRIVIGVLGLLALWATGDFARSGFMGGAGGEAASPDAPRTVVTKTIRVTAPNSDFPLKPDSSGAADAPVATVPVAPATPADTPPPASTPATQAPVQAPATNNALPPASGNGAQTGSMFDQSFSIFNQKKK